MENYMNSLTKAFYPKEPGFGGIVFEFEDSMRKHNTEEQLKASTSYHVRSRVEKAGLVFDENKLTYI